LKKSQVKIGMTVAVNSTNAATLYTVAELDGWNARLTYKVGKRTVGGGTIHVSCLRHPTLAQLRNAGMA